MPPEHHRTSIVLSALDPQTKSGPPGLVPGSGRVVPGLDMAAEVYPTSPTISPTNTYETSSQPSLSDSINTNLEPHTRGASTRSASGHSCQQSARPYTTQEGGTPKKPPSPLIISLLPVSSHTQTSGNMQTIRLLPPSGCPRTGGPPGGGRRLTLPLLRGTETPETSSSFIDPTTRLFILFNQSHT